MRDLPLGPAVTDKNRSRNCATKDEWKMNLNESDEIRGRSNEICSAAKCSKC